MPITVTANDGDCLCGIAMDHGLIDCAKLRAISANSGYLNRPLKTGDVVTVPDREVSSTDKPVDKLHEFKVKSSPPVAIRFVHGSPDQPYQQDATTTVLHVSNFVTNLGGDTGLKPFPKTYGFNDDGHQDPDTFKVEVKDPAAGANVKVKLEALKPLYEFDEDSGWAKAIDHEVFADATRKLENLECDKVSATTATVYRSKYLRLVVDEKDKNDGGAPDQCLLVTDTADGVDDDNDMLEILDQQVKATYEIARCPGSPKCKVTTTAPIGGDERQRVRVHFHVFRSDVDADMTPGGVTEDVMIQHLRRRTGKWYRRVFAQADLAPKIIGMDFYNPPEENMLCLSHSHGRTAKGGTIFRFRITTDTRDEAFAITLIEGETPVAVGERAASLMLPGFKALAYPSVRAVNALHPACDVIVTAENGERVTILDAQLSADSRMTVAVARVDLMNVLAGDADIDASVSFLSIDFKRILRAIDVTDDAMHCIVVGEFNTKSLRGQAFQDCALADAPFRPELPFRAATIMAYNSRSGKVLDGGDNLPFTSPHESAHTLCNLIHTKAATPHARTELMAGGTSVANAVDASKRLCDGPYTINMGQNQTTTMVQVQVRLAERIRTLGSSKTESW